MSDVSIRATATTAAPMDYKVPGAQEILPKSVTASMDGTGAGSAWFPCLQLLDPAGNVMFSAIASSSVAAGVSADVSWFPRVAAASGIQFDQPNTDPLGSSGELLIDTGLIEIGNVIPADWEITAIDYQWTSSGTSGWDMQANGGDITFTADKTAGGAHGDFTASGQAAAALESGAYAVTVNAVGGVTITGPVTATIDGGTP